MRNKRLKMILLASAAMISSWLALAQQSAQNQAQTVWGAVSNGICGGICIITNSFHENDVYCSMELGNTTTNLFWVWFPPLEQRYEIQLLAPDGNRVHQLKPLFLAQKTRWSGLKPLSTNSTSCSLDWFFLKDTFDIRTNGQFTLIASMRVNVFTNFAIGQYRMQSEPVYFLLPPVTNTFTILPTQLDVQTNSLAK